MKSILTLFNLGKSVRINPMILNSVNILKQTNKKTSKNLNQNQKSKEKNSPQKYSIGLTWNINVDVLWWREH